MTQPNEFKNDTKKVDDIIKAAAKGNQANEKEK